MATDILYPLTEACENLYASLATKDDKSNEEEIIMNHIKSCIEMQIQIEDFKNDLEWFNVSQPLSLKKELRGKVVVLDFFTYCCINCLHILPILKQLENEHSVEDGLVVVGVHSAKFDNEKDSANILAAVQRYNISHPVVNDANGNMWHNLSIPCWPTLLILGPSGEALFLLIGEGHKDDVLKYVKCALRYYSSHEKLQSHQLPLSQSQHIVPGPLLFPAKLACIGVTSDTISVNNNDGERLAVSDTGHHRIIVFNTSSRVEHVIGGDEPGFSDGCFKDARFSSPQGLVFRSPTVLYVADTENHAIREVNLKTFRVSTLFEKDSSSPWDLCLVSSSLLKEAANPGDSDSDKDVLLIAMAGLHQIWALFFNTTTWWKRKVYEAGTCISIAGTGKEENRNNMYPHAAAFAQPSGLTVAPEKQAVFIADSESSTIRRLSLIDGKVAAVVGGDRSPFNLFMFGDKDGKQFEAKLQHPLGVAWNRHDQTLYVADSYNHKLKCVDIEENISKTLLGSGSPGNVKGAFEAAQLSEPGGLCISSDGTQLYVADTNNHTIKVIQLQNKIIEELAVFLPSEYREPLTSKSMTGTVVPSEVKISSSGGEIHLTVSVALKDGIELTSKAPQKWAIEFPDASWSASLASGEYAPSMNLRICVPKKKRTAQTSFSINYRLYICIEHSQCSLHNFRFMITVAYDNEAPGTVQHQVSHVVSMSGGKPM